MMYCMYLHLFLPVWCHISTINTPYLILALVSWVLVGRQKQQQQGGLLYTSYYIG
jgi:hypothetical protein